MSGRAVSGTTRGTGEWGEVPLQPEGAQRQIADVKQHPDQIDAGPEGDGPVPVAPEQGRRGPLAAQPARSDHRAWLQGPPNLPVSHAPRPAPALAAARSVIEAGSGPAANDSNGSQPIRKTGLLSLVTTVGWAADILGILGFVGLALVIREVLLEARYIPSGSMLPGLQLQDRLLVEKVTYRQRPPRRGGGGVPCSAPFRSGAARRSPGQSAALPAGESAAGERPARPADPACDAYIKRVVAVGGDRVVVNPVGRSRSMAVACTSPT